jgi:protein-S-isoprenylcysteine O-methyltransferase Ste14
MALQEEFEKQGNWLFRYRSYLPFIIIVVGVLVYMWTELHPENYIIKEWDYLLVYEWLCVAVSLLGLVIRVFTVGYTPKNTSGRNVKAQVADTLNTSGIYSMVRHPLYLGNFFMWLGPVMLAGHIWFIVVFCFFYWVYYERIMFAEEQFLRKKFGEAYLEWSKDVPAFIPSFRHYKRSDLHFSWRKVLKKEKNGLAAVFLIFCLLDILGVQINGIDDYNYVLMALCVATTIAYLILKYLKRKTTVLDEEGR